MIQSYSDLNAAVASWLARDDLAANIPDFVALFEAAANRRLRVREQEAVGSLAPTGGAAPLPADYLAWRRVTWSGSVSRDLDYVHPSYLARHFPTAAAGIPRVFTIEGGALKIRPVDSATLELGYFQRIPALSSGNPSNWLLAAHPDLYMFGALAEAQGFNVDFDKLAVWKARRDELLGEIETLNNKTRGAGSIRASGPTP